MIGLRRLGLAGVVSLCALTGVLLFSNARALGAQGHIFGGSFGKAGTGNGELSEPAGVSVNEATNDVYVVDKANNRVEYFDSAGAYLGQFDGSGSNLAVEGKAAPTGRFSAPESIAIDNDPSSPSYGDVYVADISHEVIDKFSATGAYVDQLGETSGGLAFGKLFGVAVDGNGVLWVSQENNHIDSFSSALTNEFLASVEANIFGGTEAGFAVDAKGDFYVKNFFYGISKLDSSGSVLVQKFDSLDPEPGSVTVPSGIAVDLLGNDVYIDNADGKRAVGRFTSAGSLIESFGFEHLSKGTGIAVNSKTGAVYVADSSADLVDVFTLEPQSAPVVEDEATLNVAATSATFFARINPHGASTEYRFEYGPATTYGRSVPVPDASVGSGFGAHEVSVHPQDLSPGTIYHFRVVTHNELGTTYGEDRMFTTQPLGGELKLPDGRMWEMVSPPQKEGSEIAVLFSEYPLQAASDGGAITYSATIPTEPEPQGNVGAARVLSSRGPSGWSSRDINVPHKEVAIIARSRGEAYKLFSTDLAYGLLELRGSFEALSPEATERTPYLRSNYANQETREACMSSCYRPLVTASNVPSGTVFGGPPNAIFENLHAVAATPDLSHLLLTGAKLTSTGGSGSLYMWDGGQLQLVSVLPASEGGGPAEASVSPESAHTISSDGRRVFWGSYVRDLVTHETVQMAAGAVFQAASSDGSRAFLTQGGDLYAYDVNAPAGQGLTDLTVDHPGVLTVLGSSEDGSYVYFAAGEAHIDDHLAAKDLYVVHNNGSEWEAPRHVASLAGEDHPDWLSRGGRNFIGGLTSRVSPNGRYLAFMSEKSLTGYDNRDAVSGKPDEEVYIYDANTRKLSCASCDPTGARPNGLEYGKRRLIGRDEVWKLTTWLAANIPAVGKFDLFDYQSRYLSDSGRLFFNSSDALVPQDVNGTEDVYEYEPAGIGNCATSNTTFSDLSGGCVSLISSGASAEESAFLDASETGGDVFFMTSARLAPQDFDTAHDVYDAHECTSQAPCVVPLLSPPPCSTSDSCRAAPAPQPSGLGAPSSATFSGSGNVFAQTTTPKITRRSSTRAQKLSRALKACAKKRNRKRRAACERTARKRYGKTAAHKANGSAIGHRSSDRVGR